MLPYFYIVLATALWAVWGSVLKLTGIHPAFVPFYASSVAAVLLAVILLFRREKFAIIRSDYTYFALLAVALLGSNLTVFPSFKYLPVAEATLIHYLAPVFIVCFDRLIFHIRITSYALAALTTALTGLAVILAGSLGTTGHIVINIGVVYALAGAIFYAATVILSKILAPRYNDYFFAFATNAMGAVLLLPVPLIVKVEPTVFSFAILTATSIATSLIAVKMYLAGLRRMQAHTAGLISYGEPFFAGLWAFILVGERPSWATLTGSLFIVLSGTILFIEKMKQTKQK